MQLLIRTHDRSISACAILLETRSYNVTRLAAVCKALIGVRVSENDLTSVTRNLSS